MNAAFAAALNARLSALLTHVGVAAEYRVGGSGTAIAVVVGVAESADDIAQRPGGRDLVRLADMVVRRALLAAEPAHDDTVTIASGAHAGTWVVLGIERRDEVALVLRVRRAARIDAATPGAREVRR